MTKFNKIKVITGWFRGNQDINTRNSPDLITITLGKRKWYPKDDKRCRVTIEWQEPILKPKEIEREL